MSVKLVRHSDNVCQSSRSYNASSPITCLNDVVSGDEQSVLIPLRTFAVLPGMGGADVAELHMADTSNTDLVTL